MVYHRLWVVCLLAPLLYALPLSRPAAGPSVRSLFKRSTGDGTFYSPGLGACGITSSDQDPVVAISKDIYGTSANPNNSPQCRRMVNVCGPRGNCVTAKVVDRCVACKPGDLDMAPDLFAKLAPLSQGRIAVSWSFVDGSDQALSSAASPSVRPRLAIPKTKVQAAQVSTTVAVPSPSPPPPPPPRAAAPAPAPTAPVQAPPPAFVASSVSLSALVPKCNQRYQ
ncbi:hypothetical protein RI367_005732 [Sorochytrium milnesiophthora]